MQKLTDYAKQAAQWFIRGLMSIIIIPLMFVFAAIWWLISLIVGPLITIILWLDINSHRSIHQSTPQNHTLHKKKQKSAKRTIGIGHD